MPCKQSVNISTKLFQNYVHPFRKFVPRWKSSVAGSNRKVASTSKALEYFDDFYGNVFKKMWPSMRLALLSTQKYIAVVNNFSDTQRIINKLESLGGVNLRQIFQVRASTLNEESNTNYDKMNWDKEILDRVQKFRKSKKGKELMWLSPPDNAFSLVKKIPAEDRLIEPSLGMSASALLEYIPPSEIKGMENWVSEYQHYSYYVDGQQYSVNTIEQEFIEFPPHLHAYTFEQANVEQFPSPKKGTTGVTDYYLLNGGSLLPVLALDLKPGDKVLDLCAAPGGKALLSLQTLYPRTVVLNDISNSRINKINNVMKEFFYNFEERKKREEIVITQNDGRLFHLQDTFNKILVDVPCTTDRHSLTVQDNNIFKSSRVKERITIPQLQSELLINALKMVKVGGTVVYSTCSLSPTQNNGVVGFALRELTKQTTNQYIVIDMKKALQALDIVYCMGNSATLGCGHTVIPYLPANFGPTYFCKIIRLE